ncbi:hypothetical protein ACIGBN_09040 [Marinomonas sp. NPDC078689]|jgi:hypothetical protein
MTSPLVTIALGGFAIFFVGLAVIAGLVILKKYKAEQLRIKGKDERGS